MQLAETEQNKAEKKTFWVSQMLKSIYVEGKWFAVSCPRIQCTGHFRGCTPINPSTLYFSLAAGEAGINPKTLQLILQMGSSSATKHQYPFRIKIASIKIII